MRPSYGGQLTRQPADGGFELGEDAAPHRTGLLPRALASSRCAQPSRSSPPKLPAEPFRVCAVRYTTAASPIRKPSPNGVEQPRAILEKEADHLLQQRLVAHPPAPTGLPRQCRGRLSPGSAEPRRGTSRCQSTEQFQRERLAWRRSRPLRPPDNAPDRRPAHVLSTR